MVTRWNGRTGDPEGPVFPTDGTLNVLTRHLNKILERDWKIDFGTLCDHCRNEIMMIMVKMGFRIQGFKNGKYTGPRGGRIRGRCWKHMNLVMVFC